MKAEGKKAGLVAAMLWGLMACINAWAMDTATENPTEPDIGLVVDPAPQAISGQFQPGSQVKLFVPNLPYIAISHAINGALIRPANNERGWQYYLATDHRRINDTVWEFELRQDAHFQDGSPFNADAVMENMAYFERQPFTFSKLHELYDRTEKLDDYRVRFHLKAPYGAFLHDVIWLQFYTRSYLEKFGWNGKPTCPNLAEPGPYGLGPYQLVEGYVEGDRRTAKVVLKADPNYWGQDNAKVETITLFTDLPLAQARDGALRNEGQVDITPISFADQLETIQSPFAKLVESTSMNNYAMHINMVNGNPALQDDAVRFAINEAIDLEYLLNLSMLGAGQLSPTTVSPHFYQVPAALELLEGYFRDYREQRDTKLESLRQIIRQYQQRQGRDPDEPLRLTLFAQESFDFLTRDIRYFLSLINVELIQETLASEKLVFAQLFQTWKGENRPWDLLLWGNYDWYKHPWTAFFVYRPQNAWSSLPPNEALTILTDRVMASDIDSAEYPGVVADLIRHVHEHHYMVFLPTPNSVFAVNKEVVFNPGRSAFVYLRDLEVTGLHWSVRGDRPYPEGRKQKAFAINRQNF